MSIKKRFLILKLGVSGIKDVRNTNMMIKNVFGMHTSLQVDFMKFSIWLPGLGIQ